MIYEGDIRKTLGQCDKQYDIITADPPWAYGEVQHTNGEKNSSAKMHYPTMDWQEIADLNVEQIAADNSLAYLWTTGPQLHKAKDVLNGWGYDYSTIAFVWDKVIPNTGSYTMSRCEYVAVGKRGSIPKPRGSTGEKQLVRRRKTEHSAKPQEVARRIEKMHPQQSKAELFARRTRNGWDAFGNEVQETNNKFFAYETD